VEVALREFRSAEPGFPLTTFRGGRGVGKSLLAHGAARLLATHHPRGTVSIYTGSTFCQAVGLAIETNSLGEFRRRLRSRGPFVLDGIHRLVGRLAAQEELLGLLDSFHSRGVPVVITEHQNGNRGTLLEPISSRLSAGLLLPVTVPGLAGLAELARWTAARFGSSLSPSVCQQLASIYLEGQLAGIDANRSTGKFLRVLATYLERLRESRSETQALRDLPDCLPQAAPSPRQIVSHVAQYFDITPQALRGPSRQRQLAQARAIAIYLTRQITGKSLQEVGRYFGHRDHTTVLHACRKAQRLVKEDPFFRQTVEEITGELSTAAR